MHEMALVNSLVRKIESVVRDAGGSRAVSATVRLGAWCHLSPAHLREHFEQAARGTCADGMVLHVTTLAEDDPRALDVILDQVELES